MTKERPDHFEIEPVPCKLSRDRQMLSQVMIPGGVLLVGGRCKSWPAQPATTMQDASQYRNHGTLVEGQP